MRESFRIFNRFRYRVSRSLGPRQQLILAAARARAESQAKSAIENGIRNQQKKLRRGAVEVPFPSGTRLVPERGKALGGAFPREMQPPVARLLLRPSDRAPTSGLDVEMPSTLR